MGSDKERIMTTGEGTRVEDSDEYKRIYAKWASKGRGGQNAAAASGAYTTYQDLTGDKSLGEVPAIEDADPKAEPMAAAPTLTVHSDKLDNFKICGRCQGAGEYKTYVDMGHGCTREIVMGCESDFNGAPCDGGIVPKNWKPGQTTDDKTCKPCPSETSDGKFDGKSGTTKETEEECASLDAQRETQITQALRGEEPVWRVSVLPPGSDGEDDETWLEAEVELPLVLAAAEIEACVEHMRFLEVHIPGKYTLRAELPEYVDDEDMECKFSTANRVLTVRVPVVEAP